SPVPRGFGLATAAAVLLAVGFGSYYYLRVVAEKEPANLTNNARSTDPLLASAANGADKIAVTPEPRRDIVRPPLQSPEKEKSEILPAPLLVEDSRKPSREADSIYTTPSVPAPEGH